MVEIVIGDVHARVGALRALLRAVGAVDEAGRRNRGCWVVQIGDLLDRRATAAANLAAARVVASTVDLVLAGNQELQMLNEPASVGAPRWPLSRRADGPTRRPLVGIGW